MKEGTILVSVETGKRVEFIQDAQDQECFVGKDLESGWIYSNWMKDCFMIEKEGE